MTKPAMMKIKPKRRRRRGRRGGRNRRRSQALQVMMPKMETTAKAKPMPLTLKTQDRKMQSPQKIIIEVSRSDDNGEEDASEETSDDASRCR